MILEEYLEYLNDLIKENPSCLKLEVRYDINNKDCNPVKYPPSIGIVLVENGVLKPCIFVN
jgi:hypothetical protein